MQNQVNILAYERQRFCCREWRELESRHIRDYYNRAENSGTVAEQDGTLGLTYPAGFYSLLHVVQPHALCARIP
jgi:hypothetical protein